MKKEKDMRNFIVTLVMAIILISGLYFITLGISSFTGYAVYSGNTESYSDYFLKTEKCIANGNCLKSLEILVPGKAVYFLARVILGNSILDTREQEEDYANCIKNQEITLYINDADSADALGRISVLDYLKYFKIHNCFIDDNPCLENEITDYPAWIINGKKIERNISIEELSEYSGCILNE